MKDLSHYKEGEVFEYSSNCYGRIIYKFYTSLRIKLEHFNREGERWKESYHVSDFPRYFKPINNSKRAARYWRCLDEHQSKGGSFRHIKSDL